MGWGENSARNSSPFIHVLTIHLTATDTIFLSFPFILIGLAVIHTIARDRSNAKVALWVFYALVFVLGVVLGLLALIAIILALIGACEYWVGVRKRIRKSAPD